MKPFDKFKADFAAICVEHGGAFSERDTIGAGAAYHIPTRLGVLRASIHHDGWKNERGNGRKIESIYLKFETRSTGKVYDSLLGYDFNGYSGKWNILISAGTLAEARAACLTDLRIRLERLAEELHTA